jgi:tetratricopeptide (TPR) repeat protein
MTINSIGNTLKKEKNYNEAIEAYQRCLLINDNYLAPHLGIA